MHTIDEDDEWALWNCTELPYAPQHPVLIQWVSRTTRQCLNRPIWAKLLANNWPQWHWRSVTWFTYDGAYHRDLTDPLAEYAKHHQLGPDLFTFEYDGQFFSGPKSDYAFCDPHFDPDDFITRISVHAYGRPGVLISEMV